jgi:hypothetical protein
MADKKISALTAAATPLDGTEVLPIVQSGATVKVANNDLRPKQIQSNASSGVLQVAGPAAASTRVMTVPNANFTAARTDAAQSFTGDQTLSTGNIIQGTAAKGFNFTANTPAAGMTSQLMSWYEEGTFTSGIAFGGGTTGITYGAQYGFYTRIGRQVYVNGYVALTNKGSSTGTATITGLPFTSKNAPGNYGPGSLVTYDVSFSGQIFASVTTNAATATFYQSTLLGVRTNVDNTNFVNSSEIIFSFVYIV